MRTHSISVVATALVTGALARPATIVRATPAGAAGTIGGKVTYTGTPPKMKPIDMAKEPNCVTQQQRAPGWTKNAAPGLGKTPPWGGGTIPPADQGSAPGP